MSRSVFKSPKAMSGIIQIAEHIANSSLDASDRFVEAVERTFDFLRDFPESGEALECPPPYVGEVRIWQVKGFRNHLILYRLHEDNIEILNVYHGSRLEESVLRDSF